MIRYVVHLDGMNVNVKRTHRSALRALKKAEKRGNARIYDRIEQCWIDEDTLRDRIAREGV